LSVAGSLQLNGPTLEVALVNGFTPAAGDTFRILSFAAASGSFGAVALPALAQGLTWNTDALYTQGTIRVDAAAPQMPDPPTINVTSGASQSITLPDAPSPIAFTLTGSGTLTVRASSSNPVLLPDSNIAISSGCGESTLSCTATLTPVNGQAGASTISLSVADAEGRTAVTTASLEVAAARAPPSPEPGTGSASTGGSGGGGSLDFLSMLMLGAAFVRRRVFIDSDRRTAPLSPAQ
jgi:hypothetical protein